jgi:hypothetical protein
LGLDPCKARLEFEDTDELNIKLFSDGVSDVIVPNTLLDDAAFMKTSNAHETVDRAVARWKQDWKYCNKNTYLNHNDKTNIKHTIYNFNHNKDADDVSCISWIQTSQIK